MTSGLGWKWWLALVVLLCAATYFMGNGSVPLWDRDEGWYAQCSKQMWETGDWVVPRFLDNLRTEKPIFVYWLQLGGYALFGGPGEFAVRFYAGVAQILVVVMLGVGLVRLAGAPRAVWTAFIYGTCVMAIVSAKMCLTDATLMVFVTAVQLLLMAFYMGRFHWTGVLIIGIALGFGALTKGPVVLVPPAFTLLALAIIDWRKWLPLIRPGTARFWEGFSLTLVVVAGLLAIMIAICLPWLITLHQREPMWLPGVMGAAKDHLTQSMDGHKGPFGYYMALIWGTYFPWSLLIPMAAYIAWKRRHDPMTRFAIAAFLGPWLFFEFMKTKLPHYPLPTYPFLSLLVADAILRCAKGEYSEFFKKPFQIGVAIWAIPVGLVASAPWISAFAPLELPGVPYVAMTVVSIAGLACTIGTWWFFYQRKPLVACAYLGTSFMVLVMLAFGWMIPQSTYLHTSSRVAEVLEQYDGIAAPKGEVMTLIYYDDYGKYGYREPTLPYYQGGTLREWRGRRLLEDTAPEQWPRLMVITDEIWERIEAATKEQIEVLGIVRGYLYSDERRITDVYVIRRKQ